MTSTTAIPIKSLALFSTQFSAPTNVSRITSGFSSSSCLCSCFLAIVFYIKALLGSGGLQNYELDHIKQKTGLSPLQTGSPVVRKRRSMLQKDRGSLILPRISRFLRPFGLFYYRCLPALF